jgi:DNA polymerase III subunit gamma/tau
MANDFTLARKYRPRTFSEIQGQDSAVRLFKNFLKATVAPQALLITGTRGVGKTTFARIYATALNCTALSSEGEPCLQCLQCRGVDGSSSLAYTELDAASNNSVDDIRSLMESAYYSMGDAVKKIYVLDEVHMLSQSAFNALLKMLEEPPSHITFILATTDPQKIPETVLSRCLKIDLHSLSQEMIKQQLLKVMQAEEIQCSHHPLVEELAKVARGSMRDALSLLNQMIAYSGRKLLTEEVFNQSLGRVSGHLLAQLKTAIFEEEMNQLLEVRKKILEENIELSVLSQQLLSSLFQDIQVGIRSQEWVISKDQLMWLYEKMAHDFSWILSSPYAEDGFWAILYKLTMRYQLSEDETPVEKKKTEISSQQLINPLKWDELEGQLYDQLIDYSQTVAGYFEQASGVISYHDQQIKMVLNFPASLEMLATQMENHLPAIKKCVSSLTHALVEKIDIQIVLKELEEQDKTLHEKKMEIEAQLLESRENQLRNADKIKMIEDIFQAKVDKVQLKK